MARAGISVRAVLMAPVGQLVGSTIRSAPQQHQATRRFGKAAVVADVHAEAQAADVVDRERLIARRREAIDAEERQMNLAIGGDDARGPISVQAL